MTILDVKDLCLSIGGKEILKRISLELTPGRITGLIGESGSGKSLTALSIVKLLPRGSRLSGSIAFNGKELLEASEDQMCHLRGDDIGMVFQEPMTALNPLKPIGEQVAEGIRLHKRVGRGEARDRAGAILERVGLPPDRFALSRYPHELSGGQRQRVGIAIACALEPAVLIADEPTTALDVLVQAQILDLLNELVEERDMALLLISHDLGVVAEHADDLVILRQGEITEKGETPDILTHQRHPYTRRLAEASAHVPKRKTRFDSQNAQPLLIVDSLQIAYPSQRRSLFQKPEPFIAVSNATFQIRQSEIVGLVGESGCGKTSLARTLLGLHPAASGRIQLTTHKNEDSAPIERNRRIQAVFQDPYASFNPRRTAEWIVAEALFDESGRSEISRKDRVSEALENVGLTKSDAEKYPHEFSGGQRQRLAIARAIISSPDLVIADEPVSALDVSIRAQILDLIVNLRERLGVAWLFVSHDLSVVRALCDHVIVMRQGRIIEQGPTAKLYAEPQQRYTADLIAAAPDLHRAIENRTT